MKPLDKLSLDDAIKWKESLDEWVFRDAVLRQKKEMHPKYSSDEILFLFQQISFFKNWIKLFYVSLMEYKYAIQALLDHL